MEGMHIEKYCVDHLQDTETQVQRLEQWIEKAKTKIRGSLAALAITGDAETLQQLYRQSIQYLLEHGFSGEIASTWATAKLNRLLNSSDGDHGLTDLDSFKRVLIEDLVPLAAAQLVELDKVNQFRAREMLEGETVQQFYWQSDNLLQQLKLLVEESELEEAALPSPEEVATVFRKALLKPIRDKMGHALSMCPPPNPKFKIAGTDKPNVKHLLVIACQIEQELARELGRRTPLNMGAQGVAGRSRDAHAIRQLGDDRGGTSSDTPGDAIASAETVTRLEGKLNICESRLDSMVATVGQLSNRIVDHDGAFASLNDRLHMQKTLLDAEHGFPQAKELPAAAGSHTLALMAPPPPPLVNDLIAGDPAPRVAGDNV